MGFQNADKVNYKHYKLIGADGTTDFVTGAKTTNKSTVGNLNDLSDSSWSKIPNVNFLAYWNGRFNSTDSSLLYCNLGKFGTGAVRNIKYGTAAPTGTSNTGDIYIQYTA